MQGKDELRILILEDSAGDVLLVEEALAAHGLSAQLQHCEDGETALAELGRLTETSLPDLIIVDLNLPRVDGMQLLRHLRSLSLFDKTPVMIFTSSQSVDDRKKAEQLGANAYFTKPTGLDDFLSTVADAVRRLTGASPFVRKRPKSGLYTCASHSTRDRRCSLSRRSVMRPLAGQTFRSVR